MLHISQQWPTPAIPLSGLFVVTLLRSLREYGVHDYRVFVPQKIVRSDISARLNVVNLRAGGILHRDLAEFARYMPAFGVPFLRGLNAPFAGTFLLPRLLRLVRTARVDIVHAHTGVVDGHLALRLSQVAGIPYVLHVHGGEATDFSRHDRLYRRYFSAAYRGAAAVVCNSRRSERIVQAAVPETAGKTTVIPFGIDSLSPGAAASSISRHHRPHVSAITVARLVPSKRIDILLQAIARDASLSAMELTVVGDGPERQHLEALTDDLRLAGRVKFLGALPNDVVRSTLSDYDFFVLPAVDEGFGVAYLEALSSGLPCVGIEGEGCSDIAQMGDCLLLAKPNDIEDLAMKIRRLAESRDLRQRMSIEARRVASQHYAWPAIVAECDALYTRIAAERVMSR